MVAFTAPKKGIVVEAGSSTKWEEMESFDAWAESNFTPIHPQPEPEPKPIPVEQRIYPYVGVNGNLMKVLFTEKETGMVVDTGINEFLNHGWKLLSHQDEWEESDFTPIHVSKIIIELD